MLNSCNSALGDKQDNSTGEIKLPNAKIAGKVSLEEALSKRRSVRRFEEKDLTIEEIGQLLWAGCGLNADVKKRANRTAPSAGAIYPMQVYSITKDGFYRYIIETHSLKLIKKGDLRQGLSESALGQECVEIAPLSIIITGDYQKCAVKYKERAERYVHIEAGHIAENIHLQAAALNMGSVPVGAFDDNALKKLLELSEKETPLYIIPIGYPAK